MNVCGWHKITFCPSRSALARRARNFFSKRPAARQRAASRSTSTNPMLCRVAAYSGPGLPSPAMRYKFSNDYFLNFLPAGFPAGAAALPAAAAGAAGAPGAPRRGPFGRRFFGALDRRLFRPLWPALSRRLWRRLLARLGLALGPLFLLLLDHLRLRRPAWSPLPARRLPAPRSRGRRRKGRGCVCRPGFRRPAGLSSRRYEWPGRFPDG